MSTRYSCPCCGHHTFDEIPGSFAICSVCFWEDDRLQLRWPTISVGANRTSLVDAQRIYRDSGACDEHARTHVRPPQADEPLNPPGVPSTSPATTSRTGTTSNVPLGLPT
ncbi:CPCC family cysteine-rich protein [Nocardia carnea]|uniref:CPCC family cysteine-rich protein n=1 Tax=Nocardia carnea TaxID=37328 RepID=UPI003D78574B